MFWLGLILPLTFVPGWTGASIPTGWAVLSIVLPFTLWKPVVMTSFHWVGLGFLAYALSGLALYPTLDGVWELWLLAILALAFRWGSAQVSLVPLWKGLAIGVSVSSAIACAQALGYHPVLQYRGPAGLFYNSSVLGEASVLVIIALITERLWWYIPSLLPGLILSESRSVGLILIAVGIASLGRRLALLSLFLAAVVILAMIFRPDTDAFRFSLWYEVIANLSLFGSGPGSMANFYLHYNDYIYHPEYAHNEFLDLLFQFGVGALPLFWLALRLALDNSDAREWPIYAAFLVMAIFSFPLHVPVLALVGAVCAGQLARNHGLVWARLNRSRLSDLPWYPQRNRLVPFQLGTPV